MANATEEQIKEMATHIANRAETLATGNHTGPRYAVIQNLKDSIDTLSIWVGDDR